MATTTATMKSFTKVLKLVMKPMETSLTNIEKSLRVTESREDIVEGKRAEKVKLKEEKKQTSLLEKLFGKKDDGDKEGSFWSKHWKKILAVLAIGLLFVPKKFFKNLFDPKWWKDNAGYFVAAILAGMAVKGIWNNAANMFSSALLGYIAARAGIAAAVTGTAAAGTAVATTVATASAAKLAGHTAAKGRWMPLLGTAGKLLGYTWAAYSVFEAGKEYVKTGSFGEAFGTFWETFFGGMLGDKNTVKNMVGSIKQSIKDFSSSITKGILKLINFDYEGQIERIQKSIRQPVQPGNVVAAQADKEDLTAKAQNRELNKIEKERLKNAQKTLGQTPKPVVKTSDEKQKERLRINIENAEEKMESARKAWRRKPADKQKLKIFLEAQKTLKKAKADLAGYGVGANLYKSSLGPMGAKGYTPKPEPERYGGYMPTLPIAGPPVYAPSLKEQLAKVTWGAGTRDTSKNLNPDALKKLETLAKTVGGEVNITSGFRTRTEQRTAMEGQANLIVPKRYLEEGIVTKEDLASKPGSDLRESAVAKLLNAGYSSWHQHGDAIDFSYPKGYGWKKKWGELKNKILGVFPGVDLLNEKDHVHMKFNPANKPEQIAMNFAQLNEENATLKLAGGASGTTVLNAPVTTVNNTGTTQNNLMASNNAKGGMETRLMG